ncbi:hypothetical protein CVD25_04150 [Bacillus canaveralius]|uniref:Uncharacterized protein n=1 Tax=Bacillus canaveralius TaxID=1403243 RepID=A0A2N5GR42_9BACI|nr:MULTISPECIES: hypothetical protein [Bacillus]PLR85917.1 hypothetical protein CU635_02440 [Bacillus canaveralius]PLR87621.1 hypothetical protein CVD23_01760 [Bacillus sp. V33-4]PLS00036.1 hypothetical protein CVD25_04150 [Bacillus canaveralius]RSK56227.1 hypothetical protein EJA13_02400 [Bacillus canaveralius]
MNENRKSTIVKEILYWKENRLLPEQYCNYLLTLYTEGNRPVEKNKQRIASLKSHFPNIAIFLLIPIFIFVIYFTELSFILQMALGGIFIIAGLLAVFYFSRKGISFQVPLIVSALIFLLLSVEGASVLAPNRDGILYIICAANCLLWIFTGWKLKLLYFCLAGILGAAIIIISIFV